MFAVFPSTSHLYPVIPLAWALQNAGHEVCVVGHPGMGAADMAPTATRAGLTAVTLGDTVVPTGEDDGTAAPEAGAAPADSPDDGGARLDIPADAFSLDVAHSTEWEQLRDYLVAIVGQCYPLEEPGSGRPGMVDELVGFARSWQPDLVLWDPLCLPAPVAARSVGAAHARILWGQDKIAWVRAQARERGDRTDPLVELVRPMLSRYGLDFTEETLLGQWSVDLVPQTARLPLDTRTLPLRWVPYNEASVLPDWLRESPERPRVCLTLGVSSRNLFGKDTGFPLAEVLDMVAELDIELVATLNSTQLTGIGPLPDNVRAVDFVPLSQLLPTCSAIVHHGGWGTFSAAVAQRVPQLIIPVPTWDERVAARYVERRGGGIALDSAEFSVDLLRKQLVRLLEEPSFQEGAARLYADRLAAPSPGEVVPALERLTAHHRVDVRG
ncbi:activator-dependent family glycosyltransferase [Streptomyces sp. CA-132043]|uniref:activator-dependent family glycosyltransferase n=1 Tax=Streptomyces sp. CA-132043 TaxID=3240048 RepID=UPI003D8F0343